MAQLSPRDVRRLIDETGCSLVSLDKPRTGHYHLRVARPDGLVATFILPSTPSDCRGLLNKTAELRRFARGHYNPITERTRP